jgi:hypothetical protein
MILGERHYVTDGFVKRVGPDGKLSAPEHAHVTLIRAEAK